MITKKNWIEFQRSGLLWWINSMLHLFGWAICYDFNEIGQLIEVYPARVKFRGFGEEQVTEGYQKVSQYLKDNINELLQESKE